MEEDNEQPGPSVRRRGQRGSREGHSDLSTDDTPGHSPSPVGTVKVRNISRDRPPQEARENKRPRISESEEAHRGDDIHMETDSEDEEIDEEDESEEEDDEEEMRNDNEMGSDQPDSIPVQDIPGPSHRRITEENVSTTMQSSLRQRPVTGEAGSFRYNMDSAIASTSATALAPPLSRTLENSPIAEDFFSLPVPNLDARRSRSTTREATPGLPRFGSNIEPPPFQRKVDNAALGDLGEKRDTEVFFQKTHGKHRLKWAHKLFFLSTELVFPGFTAYSDSRNQMPDYMGVRVRSSCVMQALLYADLLFFIAWTLSFLSHCDILIAVLKDLHGYLSICLTCLFILVNVIRLRFGLKGNEKDEVQYLALFWMTTVIVQMPLFTFIFLTDLFAPILLAFTVAMDGVMLIFIFLETIIGFIHFRSLLRDELNIIRVARRSKEASQSRANVSAPIAGSSTQQAPTGSSNVIDLSRGIPEQDSSSTDDDSGLENDNDRLDLNRDRMNFQMQIRRVSEAHQEQVDVGEEEQDSEDSNSNSSEQVTSTSDPIRRRSILSH